MLHYKNLQLYLSLGLKLKKVHRVLEFDQSSWLGQYNNFNTQRRMNAKNALEKDFLKLMNNSVYGSSIQYGVTRTVSLIGLFSEFWRDLGIFPEFGKPV